MKTGVGLVGETGEALARIVEQVKEINVNVAAIVEGAREQAVGLREINVAVNTMDQGTQQNAAMVEQSNAASHSLASEAQALFQLLAQFRVETGEPAAASPARDNHRAVAASPVHQLTRRIGRGMGASAAAVAHQWQDF